MNEEKKIDTIGDLMANVEIEGSLADDQNIDEQGTETSEASPAENKPNVESPSQEGEPATEADATQEAKAEEANIPDENNNLPFNKHPRFQEIVEEKNYFKENFEKAMGLVQQLQESVKPIVESKPTEGVKIPKFFADVYGEDPEAYAEFLNVQRQEAARVFAENQQKEQQEREAKRQIQQQEEEYIGQQFKAIEDKFGTRLEAGSLERNEFTKFFLEYPIVSKENADKYDLVRGYELFQRQKAGEQVANSAKVQQKKTIASQTIDRTASAPTQTGLTREQKAKMSFSEIAAYALKEKGLM